MPRKKKSNTAQSSREVKRKKTEPEKNSPKRFAAVALNVEQSPRGQLVDYEF